MLPVPNSSMYRGDRWMLYCLSRTNSGGPTTAHVTHERPQATAAQHCARAPLSCVYTSCGVFVFRFASVCRSATRRSSRDARTSVNAFFSAVFSAVNLSPGAAAPRVCCKGRWGRPAAVPGVSVRFACPPGKFAVKSLFFIILCRRRQRRCSFGSASMAAPMSLRASSHSQRQCRAPL